MAENLIGSGLMLTLYGMGTVFIFLLLLIAATRFMSWAVLKIDVPQESGQSSSALTAKSTPDSGDAELVAVIATAVQRYRQLRKTK